MDNSTVPPLLREKIIRELPKNESDEAIRKFQMNVYKKGGSFESDLIKVRVITPDLFSRFEKSAITSDMTLALSIGVISLVLICFHVGSIFIGTFVMIQIFFSVPIALVIYKDILCIDYFC